MATFFEDEISNFVGREEELSIVEGLIDNIEEKTKLVFISGKGGIGKTFLRRKLSGLRSEKQLNILEYDFDDYFFHSPENIRLNFAQKLNSQSTIFDGYITAYDDIQKAKDSGSNKKYIQGKHQVAEGEWKKALKETGKKNIFSFDTVDALSGIQIERIGKHFFSSEPDNSLIIVLGRPEKLEIFKKSIKKYNLALYNNSEIIELKAFEGKDYEAFTDSIIRDIGYSDRQLPMPSFEDFTSSDFLFFIEKASQGTPILIEMSLVQFKYPDSVRLELYLGEIVALQKQTALENKELSNRFKQILIKYFLLIHSNELKTLTLILAHAWPLGKKVIKKVLNKSDEEALQLMENARIVGYIKRIPNPLIKYSNNDPTDSPFFLRLHDVMREMIDEYVWEDEDSDKSLREEVSRSFISIADNVISEGGEIKSDDIASNFTLRIFLQRLKIQKVRHATCLGVGKGLKVFKGIIHSNKPDELESQFKEEVFRQIEKIVRGFHKENPFEIMVKDSSLQLSFVEFYIAKLDFFTSRGRIKEANKLVDEVKPYLDKLKFYGNIKLSEEIASKTIKDGCLKEGIDQLRILEKNCRDKGDKDAYILLFHILTTKGWAYRVQGNIDKANVTYGNAEKLLIINDLEPKLDIPLIDLGMLYQTWAYAVALKREFSRAKNFIATAQSKYDEAGFEPGNGFLESVLGRIKIESDDYDDAIKHFDSANQIIADDNHEWQSKISLGMAHAYILIADKQALQLGLNKQQKETEAKEVKRNYDLACDYLKEVEKWGFSSDIPEALYIRGNSSLLSHKVGDSENKLEDAKKYFIDCREKANKQHALYYSLRAVIGEMRVAIYNRLYGFQARLTSEFKALHDNIKEWANEIEDVLVEAIFWRTYADMRFLEGDSEAALELYKYCLPLIGENGRFHVISLKGQLERMEEIFILFSSESIDNPGVYNQEKLDKVHTLAKNLWEFWIEKEYYDTYPEVTPILRSWISGDLHTWDPVDKK